MSSKAWRTTADSAHRRDRAIHVSPIRDLRQHKLRGLDCWCQPKVEKVEQGGTLVTHNAADGRDLIERHGLQ